VLERERVVHKELGEGGEGRDIRYQKGGDPRL